MFLRPMFGPKVVVLLSFLSYACLAAPAEGSEPNTCTKDKVATIYYWKDGVKALTDGCNNFESGLVTYSFEIKGKCTFYEKVDCVGVELWDADYANTLHPDKNIPAEIKSKAISAKCECL